MLKQKKVIIAIIIGSIFLLITILIASFSDTKSTISPLQKTTIGKTSEDTIKSLPNIQDAITLTDGSTEYQLKSTLNARPNTIITKNGKATFERQLTPVDQTTPGFATISEYKKRFGEPERDIQGSKFYDWIAHTYLYTNKGFAFIGNPFTDEVFEFHFFEPTTVENYIQLYGQDLDEGAQPEEEKIPETQENSESIPEPEPAL
jgi:hypothetical protein